MKTKRDDLETIADAIPVATIEIVMYENGMVKVSGQITNRDFAISMLDTARDTVNNYHFRKQIGSDKGVLVPGYDTPLSEKLGTAY